MSDMLDHPAFSRVVRRAWRDPEYKVQLLRDTHAALAEMGINPPAGVTVKVVENTSTTMYFLLPPPPPGFELFDDVPDEDGW